MPFSLICHEKLELDRIKMDKRSYIPTDSDMCSAITEIRTVIPGYDVINAYYQFPLNQNTSFTSATMSKNQTTSLTDWVQSHLSQLYTSTQPDDHLLNSIFAPCGRVLDQPQASRTAVPPQRLADAASRWVRHGSRMDARLRAAEKHVKPDSGACLRCRWCKLVLDPLA